MREGGTEREGQRERIKTCADIGTYRGRKGCVFAESGKKDRETESERNIMEYDQVTCYRLM